MSIATTVPPTSPRFLENLLSGRRQSPLVGSVPYRTIRPIAAVAPRLIITQLIQTPQDDMIPFRRRSMQKQAGNFQDTRAFFLKLGLKSEVRARYTCELCFSQRQ